MPPLIATGSLTGVTSTVAVPTWKDPLAEAVLSVDGAAVADGLAAAAGSPIPATPTAIPPQETSQTIN